MFNLSHEGRDLTQLHVVITLAFFSNRTNSLEKRGIKNAENSSKPRISASGLAVNEQTVGRGQG